MNRFSSLKTRWQALILVAGFALAYLLVTFFIPPDSTVLERYQITSREARYLGLTVTVPLIAIWYSVFYGYLKLKAYVSKIGIKSKDGKAFNHITAGIMVLAYGLPLNAILGSYLMYLGRTEPDFLPTAILIRSYLTAFISLIAFIFISRGARMLLNLIKKVPPLSDFVIILYLLLSIIYCYLVFTDGSTNTPTHYLPVWLLIVSLVLPYLYTWYRGFVAALLISFYSKNAQGVLYKKALHQAAAGLTVIVITSVLTQYITALSTQILSLGLSSLMVLLYGLLFVMAAGYILLGLGAKHLQKIEEV